jgi:hypothetical protein
MAAMGTHAKQIHFLDVTTGSAVICHPMASPTPRPGRARGIKGGVTAELFPETSWIAGGDDALPQSLPHRSLVQLQGSGNVLQKGVGAGALRVGYCCNDGAAHVLELVWNDMSSEVAGCDVAVSEGGSDMALPEAVRGLALHSVCSVDLPADVFSSPVFFEGHLVVGCRDDHLYCLAIT